MDLALYARIIDLVGEQLAVRPDGPGLFDTKLPDQYVVTDPVIVVSPISDVPTDSIDAVIQLREQRHTFEVQAEDLTTARGIQEALIAGLHGWSGGGISMCLFESGGPTLYDWELVPPRYCLPTDFMLSI